GGRDRGGWARLGAFAGPPAGFLPSGRDGFFFSPGTGRGWPSASRVVRFIALARAWERRALPAARPAGAPRRRTRARRSVRRPPRRRRNAIARWPPAPGVGPRVFRCGEDGPAQRRHLGRAQGPESARRE